MELIDIRPPLDIYAVFSRISYKLATAISEFLDNSVQSFKDAKKNGVKDDRERLVLLFFDEKKHQFTIVDNAFGISDVDLPRALKIKSLPPDTSGRNEFGMGLKTASFWMGDKLEIWTKSTREKHGRFLSLSIQEINNKKENVLPVEGDWFQQEWKTEHGTAVIISQVRQSFQLSQLKKVISEIASRYRLDIVNEKIKIRTVLKTARGEIVDLAEAVASEEKEITKLDFVSLHEGTVLSHKEINPFKNKETNNGYEINFKWNILFGIESFDVRGRLFIKETGIRKESGIDLFRRGRIVVPKYVDFFPDPYHFVAPRIGGEIHLDKFPVSQAKDAFMWENGLETALIERFNSDEEIQRILKLASRLKFKLQNNENDINKVAKNSTEISKIKNIKIDTEEQTNILANTNNIIYKPSDMSLNFTTEKGTKYHIYSSLSTQNEIKTWMQIDALPNLDEMLVRRVRLNCDHDFFSPFNNLREDNGELFINTMRTFTILWAAAEIQSEENNETASLFRGTFSKLIQNIFQES